MSINTTQSTERAYQNALPENFDPSELGPYETRHVMNSILEKSFREKRDDFTPLKAQKILFFLHGHYLAKTNHALIGQKFEPWKDGPVISTLYNDLYEFKKINITRYIVEYDAEHNGFAPYVVPKYKKTFYSILDEVWKEYGNYDGRWLSDETHKKGTPWYKALEKRLPIIPNELIKDYFLKYPLSN